MKQAFLKLAARIDALSLRERVMGFGAAVALLSFLIYFSLLDPLFARQKALLGEFRQQQNQIAGIDAEVAQAMLAHSEDPDRADRERLSHLKDEVAQLGGALRAMQKGLVAPDKIVVLLESLLKGNNKLRLLSLKTLPPSGLTDGHFVDPVPAEEAEEMNDVSKMWLKAKTPVVAPAAPAAPVAVKPNQLLYRHGVEVVLQGSYLDMVAYMEALEAMPTQLFWGKANLNSENYPTARLTLTLYTLSLDPKWIAL
ncbi:type II secretion system protein GspM [Janthinobacterium sp.]|uniref:type II secretion system protein GspM n=1 Tax=Janthinobacterium sp. TaxID=1871054 RepID=UPI00293D51C4|nr:type II secretion system protein GspM [Janthinobacterium sp.]